MGGAAYGMPRKTFMPSTARPRIGPLSVATVGNPGAAAETATDARSAATRVVTRRRGLSMRRPSQYGELRLPTARYAPPAFQSRHLTYETARECSNSEH